MTVPFVWKKKDDAGTRFVRHASICGWMKQCEALRKQPSCPLYRRPLKQLRQVAVAAAAMVDRAEGPRPPLDDQEHAAALLVVRAARMPRAAPFGKSIVRMFRSAVADTRINNNAIDALNEILDTIRQNANCRGRSAVCSSSFARFELRF